MYQRLLVDRNRNWLPKIEALFARPGRAFVVVGAAHLVGPDGLLATALGKGLSASSNSEADVPDSLRGVTVLVAGAGLAGLAAARDLVGARRATSPSSTRATASADASGRIRDGFTEGQHAEAGGDMIDEGQHEIRELRRGAGLPADADPARRLRLRRGRTRPARRSIVAPERPRAAGTACRKRSQDPIRPYRLADQRWDSPIAADLAAGRSRSGSTRSSADDELRDDGDRPARLLSGRSRTSCRSRARRSVRRRGRTRPVERCTASTAATIGCRPRWRRRSASRLRLEHRARRRLASRPQASARSVKHGRTVAQISGRLPGARAAGDAAPADARSRRRCRRSSTRRSRASNTDARPRRCCSSRGGSGARPDRPRAFGSPLPFGAVWDGNEEQRGRAGILSLLAGGSASDASQAMLARGRRRAASSTSLDWLGSRGADAVAVAPDRRGNRTRGRAAATRSSIPRSTRRCARGSRARAAACSSPASTPASSGRAT